MNIDELLMSEMNFCFKYFLENTNLNSRFFGLTRDKYPLCPSVASISATGYSLASLVIGVENDWIEYEEGKKWAEKTLNTILKLENKNGFYHRYIDIKTGKSSLNSEISIIDTGILLCGVLTVGEYFDLTELSNKIYNRVNWVWFTDKKNNQFRLGYKNRFYGHWDNYAEQLMLYVLGAGSDTYQAYNTFEKREKNNIIYSWFGCLFTYQYSHAWINLKDTIWFNNSILATKSNIDYCNKEKKHKGYFGLSATITKKRYSPKLGAEPYSSTINKDGTLSVSALLSSIVFLPNETKEAVIRLYSDYPNSFGKYGFVTSFNLRGKQWFSDEYLGIDKGTTMVMLSNYFNNTIWNVLMKNKNIQKGLEYIKTTI